MKHWHRWGQGSGVMQFYYDYLEGKMSEVKQGRVSDRELIDTMQNELHSYRDLLMRLEQSNDRLFTQNKRMRDVLEAIAYTDERQFIRERELDINLTHAYETIVNELAAWALEDAAPD